MADSEGWKRKAWTFHIGCHTLHVRALPLLLEKFQTRRKKNLFLLQIVWNQKVWCLLWLLNVLELCSLMWRRQRKRRRRQREVQEALCGNTMPGDSFLSWWKREIFIKTHLPCPPGYKRHLRKVFHLPILRRNIPINCRLNSKGWGIGITGKQGPVLIHT